MGCEKSKTSIGEVDENRVANLENVNLRDAYEPICMLGNGAFGKVRLYRNRNNKDLLYAIKTLKKEGLPKIQFDLLKSEVAILSGLDHPNIVKYFGTIEDECYIHILMEYLKGHDLYKIISIKKYTGFDEKDMATIIDQLLKALYFLHCQNVVHRDVKPENILFSDKYDYTTMKLIDFGLATKQKDGQAVGTPYYMAPEAIDGVSSPKTDVWSVGVIVYLMLTGRHPFTGKDTNELFTNIKAKAYNVKYLKRSECSDEAKDFIKQCLEKNPESRITTEDALKHRWLARFVGSKNSNMLNNEIVDTLYTFANKSALQKEIYYLMAKITKEKELDKIKELFNQFDKDNTGTITYNEVEKVMKEICGSDASKEEIKYVWEGLDFHKDGKINYSEFLAAMMSSFKFEKEEKLWTVFTYFKKEQKDDFISYDSFCKALRSMNLCSDEKELKKCFEKCNKELKFEEFKKIIQDSEKSDEKKALSTKPNENEENQFTRSNKKRYQTERIRSRLEGNKDEIEGDL